MLLRLIDSVHQFSECGLIFVTCKRNYVFSQKTFFYVDLVKCRKFQMWGMGSYIAAFKHAMKLKFGMCVPI